MQGILYFNHRVQFTNLTMIGFLLWIVAHENPAEFFHWNRRLLWCLTFSTRPIPQSKLDSDLLSTNLVLSLSFTLKGWVTMEVSHREWCTVSTILCGVATILDPQRKLQNISSTKHVHNISSFTVLRGQVSNTSFL